MMSVRLVLLLASIPLVAPMPGAVESVEEAKQTLKGSWRAVHVEDRGSPLAPGDIDALRVILTGEKIVFKWAAKDVPFSYQLDPNTDPKQIDMTCLSKDFENILCRGIYKIEADRFVICVNTRGTPDRPKDYKTSVRSGFSRYELKREKP